MAAKYILAVLAVGFVAAALLRIAASRDLQHPQARAWLLVGVIFGFVSAWLWARV
jgi:hypothetical protein